MIETMQEMESRRMVVHRIITGHIALELLSETSRRIGMYDPMGGNQAREGTFYGIPLVADAMMDHVGVQGDARSDIRFLNRDQFENGTEVAALVIRNNPQTLNYEVIVGNARDRRSVVVAYAELAGAQAPISEFRSSMAQTLEQNAHLARRRSERMRFMGQDYMDTRGNADAMMAEVARLRGAENGPNDAAPVRDVPTPRVGANAPDGDMGMACKKMADTPVWTELSIAWES